MEKQVQRLAANLTSLLNSPSKKQTAWLQMELILLSQKRESINCSLYPLIKAISALMAQQNPDLSRTGINVFLKLFCFRSEWLEQFFRAEMLERGGSVCLLNITALGNGLIAQRVKELKEVLGKVDLTKKALVIVDLKGLERNPLSSQKVKVVELKNKTYSTLAKMIELDFPCLVGIVFPATANATPPRSVETPERVTAKKNVLSSLNTASTSKTRTLADEFERLKKKNFTPVKKPKTNYSVQKSNYCSRGSSHESTNLTVNDCTRKTFYNPYMHAYPSNVINIYGRNRHSSLNHKTKLRGFYADEEKINLTQQLRNKAVTARKLKSNNSQAKRDSALIEKSYNIYRDVSSEKRPSYAQRFFLNEKTRKPFVL